MVFFIIVFVWIGLGILSHGYFYNDFNHEIGEFSEKFAYNFLPVHLLLGPIAFIATVCSGMMSYGPRFRRYKYINGVRQL